MKNIIFLLCCIFYMSALGQSHFVEDTPEVRNWLDNMFQHLDKSKIPHGLLRDYAFELADLDIYNGKELNDSNYVDRVAFENLLRTVRSSSVGAKPFNAEEVLATQHSLSGRGKGIIGVVLYQYSYIREDALSSHLIRYENEQVFDNEVNGVWQNPYSIGYTLGFSAQDTVFYGSNISYSFPASIWKSNVTSGKVEFDADDGRGYVSVSSGSSYQGSYSSTGVKHLKMRVRLADGSYLYSHSLVKVITDNVITRTEAAKFKPDRCVDITASLPYNGEKASGRISYLYSTGSPGKLTKPFIVMEGFDPLEFVDDANPYMGDEKFGNTNLHTFVNGLSQRYAAFNKLRSEYDIIYIDLFDSKLSIQANARLFESAIELINQEKASCGCTEKNIVMGQSMGGLIARYGLKEMENLSHIHDVSLLFCQDTPHLGAHVPLGILQGMNGILRFYYDKWIIGRLALGDFKSKISPVLYSNAARQMLINYVDDNGNVDNSYHTVWQRELTKMGYPEGDNGYKMRVVSISNGQTPVIDCRKPYIYVDGRASTKILSDILMEFVAPNFFASVLGIALQDWQVFLLGFLPGSSTLLLHFEANPIGYDGRSVCNMYLRYVKKFLWMIKIRRTVFSSQRDYPLSMINYDKMPGSYYELSNANGAAISSDQAERWVQLFTRYNLTTNFENKLMFIPTVSSLDIGEGKVELTQSDYEKKYLMNFPPASPKHTPFDAFYITDGSTYHTSFEPTMLDWMLEQMKVTVDGPEVATDGSRYTIRNNTMNYNITWNTSDESVATVDNTGTLSMKKYGVITITASCVINNVTTKFHKKIMVGFPPFVLEWRMEVSAYMVSARCIDSKAETFLKNIQYEWKLKRDSESSTSDWSQTIDPWWGVMPTQKTNKVTVYMRVFNAEGIRSNPVFLNMDATAPFEFEPHTPNFEVSQYTNPFTASLDFFPNPQYEDQEVLVNNDEFKIRRVESSGGNYLYIDFNLVTSGTIFLEDCWSRGGFLTWFNMVKGGGVGSTREIMAILLFKNNYGRIVYRKVLRVRYFRL